MRGEDLPWPPIKPVQSRTRSRVSLGVWWILAGYGQSCSLSICFLPSSTNQVSLPSPCLSPGSPSPSHP